MCVHVRGVCELCVEGQWGWSYLCMCVQLAWQACAEVCQLAPD